MENQNKHTADNIRQETLQRIIRESEVRKQLSAKEREEALNVQKLQRASDMIDRIEFTLYEILEVGKDWKRSSISNIKA